MEVSEKFAEFIEKDDNSVVFLEGPRSIWQGNLKEQLMMKGRDY